jgi:hypothetical protein
MKYLNLILIALILFACSDDDDPIKSEGTKLSSIKYFGEDNSWTEHFTYDSSDKLIKTEESNEYGRRYEFEYSGDQLKQIRTYTNNDNSIKFRDSITYNSKGDIDKIYNFSRNASTNLQLSHIYKYEYDEHAILTARLMFSPINDELVETVKYYWTANNIYKIERFNKIGELDVEFYYSYDLMFNYKKQMPRLISDPISGCENNVSIRMKKDHSGLRAPRSEPMEWDFEYNQDNRPVVEHANYGWRKEFKYQ